MSYLKAKETTLNYFNLTKTQYVVMLGVAISGLSTLLNTYNSISKINSIQNECPQNDEYNKAVRIKLYVILALSLTFLLIGVILGIVLRNNPKRMITIGLASSGIFGLLYVSAMGLQKTPDGIKLGASWGSFLIFIILGFLLERKSSSAQNEIDDD
jgi:uncharacterized membrane protein